jgi:hypothetical protein
MIPYISFTKMNKTHIKTQIKIAVQLLNSSRTDGYGNGKLTHSQRNFITETVTQILEKTIFNFDQKVTSIIPKNSTFINPPEET